MAPVGEGFGIRKGDAKTGIGIGIGIGIGAEGAPRQEKRWS